MFKKLRHKCDQANNTVKHTKGFERTEHDNTPIFIFNNEVYTFKFSQNYIHSNAIMAVSVNCVYCSKYSLKHTMER
jgi:hypothetical protein